MITRKENLLLRPFQHKKYVEHRKKVIRALPRIDDITPPQRNHIYFKCKKLQNEAERHAKIERDNFILLKHLNEIMSAKRIDNYWLYEHPRFLCRIKSFQEKHVKTSNGNKIISDSENLNVKKPGIKERCIACNPEKFCHLKIIPEERVPWETKVVRICNVRDVQKQKEKCLNNTSPKFKSESKKEDLLKRRNQFQSSISNSLRNRKYSNYHDKYTLQKERPLTVVMRFPSIVHVTLKVALKDN